MWYLFQKAWSSTSFSTNWPLRTKLPLAANRKKHKKRNNFRTLQPILLKFGTVTPWVPRTKPIHFQQNRVTPSPSPWGEIYLLSMYHRHVIPHWKGLDKYTISLSFVFSYKASSGGKSRKHLFWSLDIKYHHESFFMLFVYQYHFRITASVVFIRFTSFIDFVDLAEKCGMNASKSMFILCCLWYYVLWFFWSLASHLF